MIYHLALAADWAGAVATGTYRVSTLGRTLEEEGFIHACANLEQARGVAEAFYRDVTDPMVMLSIDERLLGCPVKLEVPEGMTTAFPHIFGPVPVTAVVAATPFTV